MESTNKRRENLTWPDEDKTRKQLEAIRELAKELRTDYPTDTPDEPTNWSNEARNRRNAYIRAQFVTDENGITLHLLTGSEWLELFDMLGFSVDKETRKRFASHLNWYSFWYADFKPRLSSKYAQRIHWYVYNFLFCLRNKLQTEKDYREGKYGSKGQAYFMEIEQQPSTPTETPQISTETAEMVNVSAEGEKERITRYAGYALTDCKNKQYVGEVELPNGLTLKFKYVYNLNGKDMYTVEDWQNGKLQCSVSHESRERILDYIADILATSEPPQSPEVPQMAECTAEPCKLAQTA